MSPKYLREELTVRFVTFGPYRYDLYILGVFLGANYENGTYFCFISENKENRGVLNILFYIL